MVLINQQQEAPTISYGQMNMQNDFRTLMTQLAFLSRSYIAAVAANFGNAAAIANRLYNLPVSFIEKAELIFGPSSTEELLHLLQMHVIYLTTLVNAMKQGDKQTVDENTALLYKNADDISAYYAKINPFWDVTQWRNLLYTYIGLTIQEAVALMSGDYEKDLDIFDRLLYHALFMGDYLASGIIQYLTVTTRNPGSKKHVGNHWERRLPVNFMKVPCPEG